MSCTNASARPAAAAVTQNHLLSSSLFCGSESFLLDLMHACPADPSFVGMPTQFCNKLFILLAWKSEQSSSAVVVPTNVSVYLALACYSKQVDKMVRRDILCGLGNFCSSKHGILIIGTFSVGSRYELTDQYQNNFQSCEILVCL